MVDPRVQGTVTLASTGPIARKDVLSVFESVLRMSNAAIVRDGDLMKIVPVPEANGVGRVNFGAGQPGFGVSVVPSALHLGRDRRPDGGELPRATRRDPSGYDAQPAARARDDRRAPGRSRRDRRFRRGMDA